MRHFFLLLASLFGAGLALAHPMGNFSINHYSRLSVGRQSVEVLYLIDRAEIPTYQEIRQSGIVAQDGDSSVAPYLVTQANLLRQGLSLQSDGRAIPLAIVSRKTEFTAGAGGLPTLKISLVLRGKLPGVAGTHRLSYSDSNFPGRAGWKEMVVRSSEGAVIRDSSATAADRSAELSAYSTDLLNSPPQQLSAQVTFETSPAPIVVSRAKTIVRELPPFPAATQAQPAQSPIPTKIAPAPIARPANTPRSRFTELISSQAPLSLWVLFSAALIAAGLGALHALEPGHGKTIVAAYLVGSRGTARHAVLLGCVVTVAHTAGVFALGAITLYASRYIVPEHLYPWLGAISGLSVVGLGGFIFLRSLTGEAGEHSHAPGEGHAHWFTSLFKTTKVTPEGRADTVSLRQLFALGITGGIVPCPAALVVLLSAFSLHRIGFGLFLITAFSFGLAAVLVIVGLSMVYAKRFVSPYIRTGSSLSRYLPLLSSAFMVIVGAAITYSAFASLPIGQTVFSKDKLVPFVSVVLLGLFLGMRHSTDSDHVVAVSTLVSRQGSIRGSAAIGLLWGLGHTITIFLVGAAIIIFGVVIPPRLGLSMEFLVALMLILLGIANLTGALRWVTERFSPPVVSPFEENLVTKRTIPKLGVYHTVRPLFVGLVHGLAGSAAVALLVLSTIKSPLWATAYLLVFGFGTMLGMMLMTAAISMPLVYAKTKFVKLTSHLTVISGIASVAFGVFLVFQIGFVDGLFTSQVHWTAH